MLDNIFSWGTSASHSDSDITAWIAGLFVILILSFLWTHVLKQVTRA